MQKRIALCRQGCQQAIQETIRAEVERSSRSLAEGQPASRSVTPTLEDARRQSCICLPSLAGALPETSAPVRLPARCVSMLATL